jgi:transposase
MAVRLLLMDETWAEIAPILATIKSRAGSPPVLSDRMFIEAMLYLARTGTPWRDLPEAFGPWDAVYNRFRHIPPDFVVDGAPQRVKAAHVMISRCSTPWGRQTNCKITPTISRAWHFTTQSGGV